MTKRLLPLLVAVATGTAWAGNSLYLPPSSNSTTNGLGNQALISSGVFNPAMPYFTTGRFNLQLFDATVDVRLRGLGEFNQLIEDFDQDLSELETLLDDFDNSNATVGEVLASVTSLETTLNDGMTNIASSFYVKPGALFHVPLTPVDVKFDTIGTFSFGVSSLTQARMSLLHDNIEFEIDSNTLNDSGADIDPLDTLRTTTSLYSKQAQVFNFALGYSRPVPELPFLTQFGIEATAGARASIVTYNLSKNLYPFKAVLDAATNDNTDELVDDITENLTDAFSDYSATATIDLGVVLQRQQTQVGITLYNLNRPTLSYNSLGGDCASLTNTNAQTECYHAEFFASQGKIALQEEHVMSPHLAVDASQQWFNNQLVVGASLDLTAKTDFFGDEQQNLNFNFLAQPTAWYWPKVRFGFGKDLKDTDPTQLAFGLTLFNALHVDTAVTAVLGDLGSDNATEQGNALRGFRTSLAFNLDF